MDLRGESERPHRGRKLKFTTDKAKSALAFLAGCLFVAVLWAIFRQPQTVVNFAPVPADPPAVRPYQEKWHPDFNPGGVEGMGR